MSATELDYWMEINRREFLGSERSDLRIAKLEAAIANFAGKSLKDGASVKVLDCMPYYGLPVKQKRMSRKAVEQRALVAFASLARAKGKLEIAATMDAHRAKLKKKQKTKPRQKKDK